MRFALPCRFIAVAIGALLVSTSVFGASDRSAINSYETAVKTVEAELVKASRTNVTPVKTAEQRLALGEMLKRNEDWPQAILLLNQVLELYAQGKANDSTHADAIFTLGETYFESGQLPSARRQYRSITEKRREPYESYAGRALSRLVDVALRRDQLDELDFVFEQLDSRQATDPSGALQYARSKAHFAAKQYDQAVAALSQMPEGADFDLQAQYLLGVIYTQQGLSGNPPLVSDKQLSSVPPVSKRFAKAILQFQRLTGLTANTDAQRHVVDLAWLALGRIFYETESPLDAVDAYQHVGKESPEFATMLFELAWVYVSLEDYTQAQRTLEVLEIVAPESLGVAEGALLRADLMLRAKEFDSSLRAYQAVRSRFGPAYEELDKFLAAHSNPADYYDRLVQQRLGVRMPGDLPPVVMDWVREIEDERSFALIDDVTRARELGRESQVIARTMAGVLSAPSRARAFPELLIQIQRNLAFINRLAVARLELSLALDDVIGRDASAEMLGLREKRLALARRLQQLPMQPEDFARRDATENRHWDGVSQQLQQLSLRTDPMRATVNGVRRLLKESKEFGLVLPAERRAALTEELRASEADLDLYQDRIAELRESLARGRLQVGFGGPSYVNDAKARAEFDGLFQRELELARAGKAGKRAADLAGEAQAMLQRSDMLYQRLVQLNSGLETDVRGKADAMLALVQSEAQQVKGASVLLDGHDQQARHLFGELAKRSFEEVRERLASILIRADIGIAQQAWEVRQTHFDLVQHMQRERATREQNLNEEYRDVLHDGNGDTP